MRLLILLKIFLKISPLDCDKDKKDKLLKYKLAEIIDNTNPPNIPA